jgi:hypothetical protein
MGGGGAQKGDAKYNFLVYTLLPDAMDFFTNSLNVLPMTSNLFWPNPASSRNTPWSDAQCFNNGTAIRPFVCCNRTLPASARSPGACAALPAVRAFAPLDPSTSLCPAAAAAAAAAAATATATAAAPAAAIAAAPPPTVPLHVPPVAPSGARLVRPLTLLPSRTRLSRAFPQANPVWISCFTSPSDPPSVTRWPGPFPALTTPARTGTVRGQVVLTVAFSC